MFCYCDIHEVKARGRPSSLQPSPGAKYHSSVPPIFIRSSDQADVQLQMDCLTSMNGRSCRRLLAILAVLLVAGCASLIPRDTSLRVPLLPAGRIELRVAHIINPALPRMSDAQIDAMLMLAEKEYWARRLQDRPGFQALYA
jgi:hypothetical protein